MHEELMETKAHNRNVECRHEPFQKRIDGLVCRHEPDGYTVDVHYLYV